MESTSAYYPCCYSGELSNSSGDGGDIIFPIQTIAPENSSSSFNERVEISMKALKIFLPTHKIPNCSHLNNLKRANDKEISNDKVIKGISNLSCAMHLCDALKALKLIAELVDTKDLLSRFQFALQNEYRYLIDLAFKNNMSNVGNLLNYFRAQYSTSSESDDYKISIHYELDEGKSCFTKVNRPDVIEDPITSNFLKVFRKIGTKKKLDQQVIKTLALSYSFFIEDKVVIHELTNFDKKNKDFVCSFLDMIVDQDYPNGVSQMISAEDQLERLRKKFDLPEKINIFQLECLQMKQGVKKPLRKNTAINWGMLDTEKIAEAIILRDAALMQSIEISRDIKPWLKHHVSANPRSISDLEKTFNKTVNWISGEIVREFDVEKRYELIKIFLEVGSILLNKKNLHGAFQVALALNHPAVKRLLSKSHLEDPNYIDLSILREYFEHSSQGFGYHDGSFFPITAKFWSNWKSIYESIKWNKKSRCLRSFEEIAKRASQLMDYRKISTSQMLESTTVGPVIDYIYNYEFMSEEALFEFSSLCKEWYLSRNVNLNAKFNTWTASYFAVLILNSSNTSTLKTFFSKGILSGKEFIEKFTQDKTLIDDLPERIQSEILEHYLKSKLFAGAIPKSDFKYGFG